MPKSLPTFLMENQIHSFKVGTFNLLNLVLPKTPYYGDKEYTEATYRRKTEWIGAQLDRMQADIVGFQEVFHEEALREALSHSYHLKNAHVIMVPRTSGTPAVAIASRFPILSHEVITEFPIQIEFEGGILLPMRQFTRPVLKATIEINPDLDITFLTAHLKSKRPMLSEHMHEDSKITMLERSAGEVKSTVYRLAEALALRAIVIQELEQERKILILVGDLNDNDLAVSTQVISGEPPFRNMPEGTKREIWDVLLYHAKAIQARKSYQDYYYSHIHNGHHEAIDHIMVSQELAGENPMSIGRVGYVRAFNDHLIDETLSNDCVPEWQSDHAQIVASIELKKM